MAPLSNSSWRASAACIAGASCSQSLVEPSMSVNRNVRVPVGGLAITSLMSSLLPLKGHYSSGGYLGPLFAQVPGGVLAALFESLTRHRGRPRVGHRLTGCSKVAVKRGSAALPHLTFYLQNSTFWRADERTRTAFLLITSDHSGVAGVCRGLQMPHI